MKTRFRQHQRVLKRVVDKAKEEWVCKVVTKAEKGTKDGHAKWNRIRKLQQAHAGRRPAKPKVIRKENGEITQSPSEVLAKWQQHYNQLLNVESTYNEAVLESVTHVYCCITIH